MPDRGLVVLVCGGGDWHQERWQRDHVYETLDQLHATTPVAAVLHVGQSGAGSIAGKWALLANGVRCRAYPNARGQRGRVYSEATLALVFPGGTLTTKRVRRCQKHGIAVRACCEAHGLPAVKP